MITINHIDKIIAVLVSLALIFVSLLTLYPDKFGLSTYVSTLIR